MELFLTALCTNNVWQNEATKALHDIAPDVLEEVEMGEELEMSEEEYITASQIIYTVPKYVQHIIEAAYKEHGEPSLQRLVDDIFKRSFNIYSEMFMRKLCTVVIPSCNKWLSKWRPGNVPWRSRDLHSQKG